MKRFIKHFRSSPKETLKASKDVSRSVQAPSYLQNFEAWAVPARNVVHGPRDSLEGTQIRLIRFHGLRLERYACDLQTWDLHEAPSYYAISYVWGPPIEPHTIYVNEIEFGVRENCHQALEQVYHYLGEDEWFWIDSICINQDNEKERSLQVGLMGEIYEQAVGVLASVGAHADDSAFLMELLEAIANRQTRLDNPREIRWNFVKEAVITKWIELGEQGTVAAVWERLTKAYAAFANRTYWTRVWIVQEVRLAKEVMILLGADVAFKLSEIAFILPLEETTAFVDGRAAEGFYWPEDLATSKMKEVARWGRHVELDPGSELQELSPERAFRVYASWNCSDFRDRPHALSHITAWPPGSDLGRLKPDYSRKDKLDVVYRLAACLGVSERHKMAQSSWHRLWGGDNNLAIAGLMIGLDFDTNDEVLENIIKHRQPWNSGEASAASSATTWPKFTRKACDNRGMYQLRSLKKGVFTAPLFLLSEEDPSLYTPLSKEGEKLQDVKYRSSFGEKVLKIDGTTVGHMCKEARENDYLLHLGSIERVWLVLRRLPHNSSRFEIVGYALINRMVKVFPAIGPIDPLRVDLNVDLVFDLEDLVVFTAFYNHIRAP